MARLQDKFRNELHAQIQEKLGLKNAMEVPKITKITLNMGVGEAVADKKVLDHAVADMKRSPVSSRNEHWLASLLPDSRFVTVIRSVAR